jgi:hypothetical protein
MSDAGDEVPSLTGTSAAGAEAELANVAELKQRARSQEFSAAWADEWNPNPLSDVSS